MELCRTLRAGEKKTCHTEGTNTFGGPVSANAESFRPPDSFPELSPQWSPPLREQIGPAMPIGPNSNPSLGFQASSPRVLALKTSRLGNPETQSRTLPATKEETMPFGALQNPQSGRNLHAPLRPLPIQRTPGKNWESDASPDHCLHSAPLEPTSACTDWDCPAQGPNLNPRRSSEAWTSSPPD